MKKPLVSVVMPALNSGRYIRETIHSLIEQVYTQFELVIVDGGSSDDTTAIVRKYMGDGDVKLIELPPGLGISKALNEGIARLDADDLAYPWRLQDQVYFFFSN